jgi:hypothetical protein
MMKEHSFNTILRYYCNELRSVKDVKGFCGVQNDMVLVSLAQPTFPRHVFRKRLRVQLVMDVEIGTMRNLSIIA